MARADYAPASAPGSAGAVIGAVLTGSPAQRAGIRAGECIARVDGEPLSDVLDWAWRTDGESLALSVVDNDGDTRTVELRRRPDEPWGVEFVDVIFDRVRTCRNDCAFCFMTQLPKGLRKPLYLRDDDYRLSFLQGNFITLTNLTDDDVGRIALQHLTPLYVSLHAVDPAIRARLICAREDRTLERVDELLDAGIDLHVQIVLVPGVNDGAHLEETLTWLAEREGIESVGIVPLGYTAHQRTFSASYEDPGAARDVIAQVAQWQAECRDVYGRTWVYLADEFYLNAGLELPAAEEYDGFPQFDNGIGLVRTFVDEFSAAFGASDAVTHDLSGAPSPVLLTGTLFGPTLTDLVRSHSPHARVLQVPNAFFGGNVSVAGLLVGTDLAAAIRADRDDRGTDEQYLLPDAVFNADGLTLDGMTLSQLQDSAGASIRVVSCDAAGLAETLVRPVRPHASNQEE